MLMKPSRRSGAELATQPHQRRCFRGISGCSALRILKSLESLRGNRNSPSVSSSYAHQDHGAHFSSVEPWMESCINYLEARVDSLQRGTSSKRAALALSSPTVDALPPKQTS